MNTPREMWQILVPKFDNDGGDIPIPEHAIWDNKVREISGGLTIHRSAKGQWISPKGETIVERMIPVMIACNREQIIEIALMTKTFYEQDAVLCFKISDEVIIV